MSKLAEEVDMLKKERNLFAEAIVGLAIKLKITDGSISLTGPHILMLAEDIWTTISNFEERKP